LLANFCYAFFDFFFFDSNYYFYFLKFFSKLFDIGVSSNLIIGVFKILKCFLCKYIPYGKVLYKSLNVKGSLGPIYEISISN